METKCPNKTIGTTNVGSKLNGKYKIAIFGCSNEICWNGDGTDSIARITILNNKTIEIIFQIKRRFRFNFNDTKTK